MECNTHDRLRQCIEQYIFTSMKELFLNTSFRSSFNGEDIVDRLIKEINTFMINHVILDHETILVVVHRDLYEILKHYTDDYGVVCYPETTDGICFLGCNIYTSSVVDFDTTYIFKYNDSLMEAFCDNMKYRFAEMLNNN